MRECLQCRILQWLGHLEKIEENACHSTSRKFVVGANLAKNNREKHEIS